MRSEIDQSQFNFAPLLRFPTKIGEEEEGGKGGGKAINIELERVRERGRDTYYVQGKGRTYKDRISRDGLQSFKIPALLRGNINIRQRYHSFETSS